jgi:hypothetical protein
MGCLATLVLVIHAGIAFKLMAEAQFNGWIVAINVVLFAADFLFWGYVFERRKIARDIRRSQYWQSVHEEARARNHPNR